MVRRASITAWFLCVILIDNVKYGLTKRHCIKGMTTPGYTVPADDIIINQGDPLNITCSLNEEYQISKPNATSDNLYFERGGKVVEKSMITILNASSIRLYIDNPPISSWVYSCKLKNVGGVCLNSVYVGTKPVLEDDFNCTGFNYENLTCTWATPYNPVPTTYDLRYYIGSTNHRHLTHSCPSLQKLSSFRMSCSWTLTSLPPYRPSLSEITFELTANNLLGDKVVHKTISHFQRVVPAPPESLTSMGSTTDSVALKWTLPDPMKEFPPGIDHRVMYRSKYDNNEWQLATILHTNSQNQTKTLTYNLTDLVHAFTEYEIGVAMRSAVANSEDNTMWSRNSTIAIKTKSKVPGRPPTSTVGSFESVSTSSTLRRLRDVYIYWQNVSEKFKNGKNFVYEVELEANRTVKPIEVTNTYAKFSNLSMDESYIFRIWSSNNVGRSENSSTVLVPKQTNGLLGPTHITKLTLSDHTYELSWDPPNYPVTNYTVFACTYDRDRPYQCAGDLHWKVISPDVLHYVIRPPQPKKIHQFAISANSDEFTSGMVWADCTVIAGQIGNKLKNVVVEQVGTTYVAIKWKLDCAERIGGINGFVVRYCNASSYSSNESEWSELHLKGSNIDQANITNLMPYKKYVFVVEKLTKKGEFRQKSENISARTLEAAPTPPINIGVTNTTNSSATIFWSEPTSPNGKIRYYVILGQNHIFKVNATQRKIVVQNLTSYTEYNFMVHACTVECSRPSSVVVVRTRGGYPSKINQLGVTFQNNSLTLVVWEKPLYPNGLCDFYELQFTERQRYENRTLSVASTTEPWYVIKECGSSGIYSTFFISVRAVNILNGTRHEGPWSDELQSVCTRGAASIWLWIIGPLLLIFIFCIYLGKRTYHNYQRMRDIQVKLPPGLDSFYATIETNQKLLAPEEVPLKDTNKLEFVSNNQTRYLPMNAPNFLDNKITNLIPKCIDINSQSDEYVKMNNPKEQVSASDNGYVQVGHVLPTERRNSMVVLANTVTINTGYVAISDVLSTKKNK